MKVMSASAELICKVYLELYRVIGAMYRGGSLSPLEMSKYENNVQLSVGEKMFLK
jgi:hypothetical protein